MESSLSSIDSQSPSSSRNSWTYGYLTDFRQISPVVQTHLKQVYLSLCFVLIASAVGASLHILLNINGLLSNLATLWCVNRLRITPLHEEKKRVSLLMTSSLLLGACLGPTIQLAIELDPSILVSAFMGSAIIFACFSGAAILSRRREYLYLGGFLSSSLLILISINLASLIFGGSAAFFKIELYFGLLVFAGYIVFDTQQIIEKAHLGDLDYVKHAVVLFLDFAAVFLRVLDLLQMKSSDKKEEAKKEEKKEEGWIEFLCKTAIDCICN